MHPQTFNAFTDELTKIAKDKKRSAEARVGSALGGASTSIALGRLGEAAGSVGEMVAGHMASKSLSGHKITPQEQDILKKYAPHVNVHTNIDDLIRAAGINPLSYDAAMLRSLKDRNAFATTINGKAYAYAPASAHPSILAHELGHQSGVFGKGNAAQAMRKAMKLRQYGNRAVVGLGALGAGIAGGQGTAEKQDKAYRGAQIAAGVGSLLHVPTLAEEARASMHAVNMGRKVGKGFEYARKLAPAFGTYAATPLAVTGATIGGLELMRRIAKHQAQTPTKDTRMVRNAIAAGR